MEEWSVSSAELGVGEGWRIEKSRLHGGPSDGVDIVRVDNGSLSFTIVPTRGMSVWKGMYEDFPLGWDSPVRELVNPCFIDLESNGGLGWLKGFNEWIVRCGLSSLGPPESQVIKDPMGKELEVRLPLHGRIANTPASMLGVEVGLDPPFELRVTGVVYERSLFGSNLRLTTSITTVPLGNYLTIQDAVDNLRGSPDEMQLLYHCNYGPPILEEGARLVAPIRRVSPRSNMERIDGDFSRFGPPESGFTEEVYFMQLLGDEEGWTKTLLVNREETRAASLTFSIRELPCFTLWKNTASLEDGYVIGLEPATSFPNPKSFERKRKRVASLKAGGRYRSHITLAVHTGRDGVRSMLKEIEEIGGGETPAIFKKPLGEFSPLGENAHQLKA